MSHGQPNLPTRMRPPVDQVAHRRSVLWEALAKSGKDMCGAGEQASEARVLERRRGCVLSSKATA